jgi:hypothetical protein
MLRCELRYRRHQAGQWFSSVVCWDVPASRIVSDEEALCDRIGTGQVCGLRGSGLGVKRHDVRLQSLCKPRPGVQQVPSLLEEIAAPVGSLDLIRDRVR